MQVKPITPPNTPEDSFHLLDFDQDVFDGILLGVNQLRYQVNDQTLILHYYRCRVEADPWRQISIPLPPNKTLKQTLRLQLFHILTNSSIMMGFPELVYSEWITQKDIYRWYELKRFLLKRQQAKAAPQINSNPLLKWLAGKKLHPSAEDGNLFSWTANCPSGHRHQIKINSHSNEWGCGYCKIKGQGMEIKTKFKPRKQ